MLIRLLLLPLLWVQAAPAAPAAPTASKVHVPTVLVRGVLIDARGAPLEGRVLHIGPLDGRKAVVELRDHEILNPTATTGSDRRFSVVVPVAFFALARAFTVGAVRAETGVPPGVAQLPLVPVERNGETASFGYKGKREAVDLGEVQLASDGG